MSWLDNITCVIIHLNNNWIKYKAKICFLSQSSNIISSKKNQYMELSKNNANDRFSNSVDNKSLKYSFFCGTGAQYVLNNF